jgi:hypothetical protein
MVGVPKRRNGHIVGRSVNTTVVKTDDGQIKQDLQELKDQILAELAKILGEIQTKQLVPDAPPQQGELDSIPMYIPDIVGTGEGMEAEINIESRESCSNELDDAVAALRRLKHKRKKEEK